MESKGEERVNEENESEVVLIQETNHISEFKLAFEKWFNEFCDSIESQSGVTLSREEFVGRGRNYWALGYSEFDAAHVETRIIMAGESE